MSPPDVAVFTTHAGSVTCTFSVPRYTGLPLHEILVMPACCILFRDTLFCPGQGDSVCLTVRKREGTGPDLAAKSLACATLLPSLLCCKELPGGT